MPYPTKSGSDGGSTGNSEVKATTTQSDSEKSSSSSVSEGALKASCPSGKSNIDPK